MVLQVTSFSLNMTKSIPVEDIRSCFVELSLEAQELYLNDVVPCSYTTPTPFDFYRNHVSKNLPCIFRNAISHWPAIEKWDDQYIEAQLGQNKITVAVTPNGLADAIVNNAFILPEERSMTIKDFFEEAKKQEFDEVYYIQKQNSNMTDEFKILLNDIDTELTWASDALCKSPDAINFWMGQGKAVTSLHKDHYENLYCVVRGEKRFILYPPSDRPHIPYKNYPVRQYKFNKSGKIWTIEDSKTVGNSHSVPWICVDPLKPQFDLYPQFKNAQPIFCTVKAGDVLYLPALWFHHVQQTDWTIAVNYWYDMDFDSKYIYYQTLDKISKLIEQDKSL